MSPNFRASVSLSSPVLAVASMQFLCYNDSESMDRVAGRLHVHVQDGAKSTNGALL